MDDDDEPIVFRRNNPISKVKSASQPGSILGSNSARDSGEPKTLSQNVHTHARAHTNTHTHSNTHAHGHARTHTNTHTNTHIHTQTHVNSHAHTHPHAHTHAHTHGHTHGHAHGMHAKPPLAGSQTQTKSPSATNSTPTRPSLSGSQTQTKLPSATNSIPTRSPLAGSQTQTKLLSATNSTPTRSPLAGSQTQTKLPSVTNSTPLRSPLAGSQTQTKLPSATNSTPTKYKETCKNDSDDDSDDDKPLAQRLQKKPSVVVNNASAARSSLDGKQSLSLKKILPNGPSSVTKMVVNKVLATKDMSVTKKRPFDQMGSSNLVGSPVLKKVKETTTTTIAAATTLMKGNSTATDMDEDDEDNIPLAQRISSVANMKKSTIVKKPLALSKAVAAAKKVADAKKAKFKKASTILKKGKSAKSSKLAPGAGGGQKWTTLEHNGVIFPLPYKPHGIKILYAGKPVELTTEQEEVATMFAVMQDTDYSKKPKFLANFWKDWKELLGSNHVIKKLDLCDFTPIYNWQMAEKEKKKQMSGEEKKRLKEEKMKQEEKFMWALVDGVKEKVGNFRVEPPGLFRGRGEHPKMGKLKRRIYPEDIVINIGKKAPIPECPMPGHNWKEIRHDNTVTWLAYWNDPINPKEFKYVFLAASSNLKGQSDREKYEKARLLKDYIANIRRSYTKKFTSSDRTIRQIAVATYLIDRLALRAGNEKDDDEADTVGCCSLKVEHVTLVPPLKLQFDFLGKDSIRYFNTVEVVEPVYKAIGDFKKNKKNGMDLFDKLDTSKLNAHLKEIMPGLTAKVFRTYNASITLDDLLEPTEGDTVQEKLAFYNSANKKVAILCNHQRSVSKSHDAQMERLEGKMQELEGLVKEYKIDLERAKRGKPPLKDADGKPKRNQSPEALQKKITQTVQKVEKMKLDMKMKDDLKTIALGTSKINYMDPRITVAWCKRNEVPIEKLFNKSLLAKFSWAMDVDMNYRF